MAKHNKKRNVGLLHEQLIRHASRMTVDGEAGKAKKAVDVVTNHFKKGTELLREFRLFSSLIHTKVDCKNLAQRIIEESRKASANHDASKLQKEKSLLIRDINHILNETSFYDQKIAQYTIFATVQALLNEWRGAQRLSPSEIAKYENKLIEHLTRDDEPSTMVKNVSADPLVLNVMLEKFNKKYSNNLTLEQKKLLEYKLMNKNDKAIDLMKEIRTKTLDSIDKFYEAENNDYLKNKKDILVERVTNYTPDETDESVSKALSLANLLSELESDQ